MSPETEKKTMFRLHLIIGVIVLLFAGIAVAVKVVDSESNEVVELEIVTESSFDGIDGSLTVFAFDMIAKSYMAYMEETEVEERVEFEEWLLQSADRLPQTDAFNHTINLRDSDQRNEFVLYSAGEDGEVETEDDYIKTYTYEPITGDV